MAKSKRKPDKSPRAFFEEDAAEPGYAPAVASTGNERWLMVPGGRLADLLRGVVAVCGEDAFPTEVAVTREVATGKTAKLGVLMQLDECERVKRLFFPGVAEARVEFHYGSGGVRPLREVIRPTFARVDLAAEASAMRPGDRRAYLFAASNEDQAQKLLAELVAVATPGIRIRPIADANGSTQFHSLWLVEGRHPPRAAFDAAGRAWWTSVAEREQGSPVFLPYPYRSDLSRADLDRIDWDVDRGFVLLNPDDGPYLVPVGDHAPATLPLIGVAAVTADTRAATVCPPADATRSRFDVTLRLVARDRAGSPTYRLLERIRELELDIDQRRQLADRLTGELTLESDSLPTFYTPLFAYRDRGEVPIDLRRLVVEWADQKALRELRYARIRAESLPARIAGGCDFHLLLTPTGLTGRPEQDGRDLWLREYAPTDGYRFDLQQNWVPHELRLFLPDDADRRMELYPEIDGGALSELRPGEMTAEQLGRAFCPTGVPTDHLFLLFPGTDKEPAVTAVRVPKSAFRPLVESYPWRCGVVVPDRPAEAVDHDLAAMTDAFLGGLDDAFSGTLGSVGKRRIEERQEDFVREIEVVNREFDDRRRRLTENRDRFDREYTQRQDSLDALRKRLSELDDLLARARTAVGSALTVGGTLQAPLRQVTHDSEQTKIYIQELSKLTGEASKLTAMAASLAEQAARYDRLAEGRP